MNPLRQLLEDCHVLLALEGYHAIVLPSEVEQLLNLCHQLLIHRLAVIKSLYKSEELAELISLVQVFVKGLDSIQNLNKLSHNVREDGDPNQENSHEHQPFEVTLGVVVSKSNRCQRGLCKVHHNQYLSELVFFPNVIVVPESDNIFCLLSEITAVRLFLVCVDIVFIHSVDLILELSHDQEQDANEETDVEKNDDQFRCLQKVSES